MKLFPIFGIAFRNVLRNKRRTTLTLASIIIGGVALVFVGGYIEYSFMGLRESTIKSELGHIQYYKKGFIEKGSIEPGKYLLASKETNQIESILKKQPQVKQFAKRLSIMGLISNGDRTVTFIGSGVEPEKNSEINAFLKVVEGEDLMDEDAYKILIGTELARNLNIKIGEYVTLLTTTFDGSINAIDFEVLGFVSRGIKEYDSRMVVMRLQECQELLGTNKVERIVTLLDKTEDTGMIKDLISKKINLQEIEFKSWDELANYYHQVVQLYNNAFSILKIVILIIIVLSIANAMVMSVMERIREIGTLRAIGTSKEMIWALFIIEGFYLGLLGGIGSVVFGWLFAMVINLSGGIYMPPPPGNTEGYYIMISTSLPILMLPVAISLISSVISSIIPAAKAAKLTVVDALFHV